MESAVSELGEKIEDKTKEKKPGRKSYPGRENGIALVIFKTLSLRTFSYPFASPVKVAEAVSVELRTVLGEATESFVLAPLFISKEKNKSSGSVFIVSGEEAITTAKNDIAPETSMIPAPLVFAGEVDGDGLVICVGDGLSAILFRGMKAIASRWMPEGTDPQEMSSWFDEYMTTPETRDMPVVIKELDRLTEKEVRDAIEKSKILFPYLEGFSISAEAAGNTAKKDLFMARALKTIDEIILLGLLFIFSSGFLFAYNMLNAGAFSALPGSIYAQALGEHSNNPLHSAIKKAKETGGAGNNARFDLLVADIAGVFESGGFSQSVTLDSLKYGRERSEIQGETLNAKEAERLKSEFTASGFKAHVTDIRQIPGGGMRFSISLEGRSAR